MLSFGGALFCANSEILEGKWRLLMFPHLRAKQHLWLRWQTLGCWNNPGQLWSLSLLQTSQPQSGQAMSKPQPCLMYLAPGWCGVNVSLSGIICLAWTSLLAGGTGGHRYRTCHMPVPLVCVLPLYSYRNSSPKQEPLRITVISRRKTTDKNILPGWAKSLSHCWEVQVGMGYSQMLNRATLQLCFKSPKAKWEKKVSGKRANKISKCRGKFHKEIKADIQVCSRKSSVNLFSYSHLSFFKQ